MLTLKSEMENIADNLAVDIYGEWIRESGLFLTIDLLAEDEVISLIKKAYKQGYIDAEKKIKRE